jgi:hypothetical protein
VINSMSLNLAASFFCCLFPIVSIRSQPHHLCHWPAANDKWNH